MSRRRKGRGRTTESDKWQRPKKQDRDWLDFQPQQKSVEVYAWCSKTNRLSPLVLAGTARGFGICFDCGETMQAPKL